MRIVHIAFLISCAGFTSCKQAPVKPKVDMQAVFFGSPEETLKPTIWDTGDTTVTNEDRLEIYQPHIKDLGGGYFGVGSIQNFTLAAWAKSEYIWLMDFTHIVVAANKIHTAFLKRLKTPAEHREMWDKKKSLVAVDKLLEEEFKGDAELPFIKASYRKAAPYLMVTFKILDRVQKKRPYKFWLNDQEQYDYLKKLATENKIRALRGDLNGEITVRGIAASAKAMGVPMRILYYSNAEEYFRGYKPTFKASFGSMPVDEKSLVVRTISFDKTRFRWAADSELSTDRGFHYSLQPGSEFVEQLKLEKVDVRDFYKTAVIDPQEYGLTFLGSLGEKKAARKIVRAEPQTQKISANVGKAILKSYRPAAPVLQKIAKILKSQNKFLLTTHVGADADGLGSQIGFYYLLKALKKDVKILNNERIPEYLHELIPGKLVNYIGEGGLSEANAAKLMRDRFVFILDSSEPHRSDKVGTLFQELQRPWATIDHHVLPGKPEFCVDPTYAATAELVWDLYKFMKVALPKAVALPLYTGLVADSGNFRYPKTSMRTHLAAGELLGFGIHSDAVFRAIYESHPIDRLKLNARIYPNVQLLPNKVAVCLVKRADRDDLALGDSGTEGIVNQLLAHKGLIAAAVLSESQEGELKGSLRSIGAVDVSAVARKFGGGGHKNAAGLKIRQPFVAASKLVIAELSKL